MNLFLIKKNALKLFCPVQSIILIICFSFFLFKVNNVQDMLNERIRKTPDRKSPEKIFYELTYAIKT